MTENSADNRSIFAANVQSLSIFRIALGLVIFIDFVFGFLPTRSDFYTETGFLPHHLAEEVYSMVGHYSLLFLFPQTWFLELFTWVYGLLIILFIIGYQTRVVKFLLLIFYTSLYYRGGLTIMGADTLMRLFLLWSLFVPLNRYWSLDSALRRGPRDVDVPPVCMAGIKMQISMLYLFSGVFKVFDPSWWDGDAVGYALRDTNNGTELGHWLAVTLPWLSQWVSVPVIIFQLLFSALVYSPFYNNVTRAIALVGAVAMHISFMFLLVVGLFPHVCLSYLPLLVPDSWWNAFFARRRKRFEHITLYTDPQCAFCDKVARLLREMCLSPFTPIVPADQQSNIYAILQQHNSWVVVDGVTGKTYLKWGAVAFVLRQTPLTYVFGVVTDMGFMKSFFANVYDAIGKHRPALGKLSALLLPYDNRPFKPAPHWARLLCGALIVVLVAINISSIPSIAERYEFPWLEKTAQMMQVYQKWDLFAPRISRWRYEYTLQGKTKNHQQVDLWALLDKSKLIREKSGYVIYFSERWNKYMTRMISKKKGKVADRFLQKICEMYNDDAKKNGRDPIVDAMVEIKYLPLEGEARQPLHPWGKIYYWYAACLQEPQSTSPK